MPRGRLQSAEDSLPGERIKRSSGIADGDLIVAARQHDPTSRHCLAPKRNLREPSQASRSGGAAGGQLYGTQSQNQIQALSDAGYITAPVSGVSNLPRFFSADETAQSLGSRVRSYLAVNCVQCQ